MAVTKNELREFLKEVYGDVIPKSMGEAMEYIVDEYGAVDRPMAVETIRETFAGFANTAG